MSKNVDLIMESWRKFKTNLNEQAPQQPAQPPDPATAQKVDQIIKLPYDQFVTQLSSVAADPKVQAVLQYGLKDGQPDDEKMKITQISPAVAKLKPTQNEIDMNGSLKFAVKSVQNLLDLLKPGEKAPGGNPIVTANGGTLVIDGHHRWSQVYCINPTATIKAVDLNIQGANAETYLKIMQMSIAIDLKKVPTQSVKGTNLLDPSLTRAQLQQWIQTNTPPDVLNQAGMDASIGQKSELNRAIVAAMKTNNPQQQAGQQTQTTQQPAPIKEKFIGTAQGNARITGIGVKLLTDLIWSNITKMRKTSQPVPPAPKRDFMPQTDDAKNWMNIASSGQVNFKEPANVGGAAKPAVPGVQKESLKKLVKQVVVEELKNQYGKNNKKQTKKNS